MAWGRQANPKRLRSQIGWTITACRSSAALDALCVFWAKGGRLSCPLPFSACNESCAMKRTIEDGVGCGPSARLPET